MPNTDVAEVHLSSTYTVLEVTGFHELVLQVQICWLRVATFKSLMKTNKPDKCLETPVLLTQFHMLCTE